MALSRPVAVVVVAEGEAVLPLPVRPAGLALELRAERVRVERRAAAHRDVLPAHVLARLEAHGRRLRGDLRALDGVHVAVEWVAAVALDV